MKRKQKIRTRITKKQIENFSQPIVHKKKIHYTHNMNQIPKKIQQILIDRFSGQCITMKWSTKYQVVLETDSTEYAKKNGFPTSHIRPNFSIVGILLPKQYLNDENKFVKALGTKKRSN